ncbi:MAG: type II toxin-antitoxin system Phd/YefM family antitoxin [SAR202 cluster bacterium]|nr:type II toxin-antitoxin system Phd/YefM family antitoxin [SAR202 cluster bacterium]
MASNDRLGGVNSISITEAQYDLVRLQEQLAGGQQAMALTQRGKPVMALMAWDLYQSIVETLDILGDPDMMVALRQSIQEATEGKVISWETVKAELDL